VRFHPLRRHRFSAYEIAGDWWVTIEWLPVTDDANVRWLWTLRSIQFRTDRGAVVPAREPDARGYAWTKAEARAEAYRAAIELSE